MRSRIFIGLRGAAARFRLRCSLVGRLVGKLVLGFHHFHCTIPSAEDMSAEKSSSIGCFCLWRTPMPSMFRGCFEVAEHVSRWGFVHASLHSTVPPNRFLN